MFLKYNEKRGGECLFAFRNQQVVYNRYFVRRLLCRTVRTRPSYAPRNDVY